MEWKHMVKKMAIIPVCWQVLRGFPWQNQPAKDGRVTWKLQQRNNLLGEI